MRIVISFLLIVSLSYSQSKDFDEGVLFFEKSQWEEASEKFLKVLELSPSNKKAREYLGDISAYQKDWDKALSYYKDLLEADNMSANYHFKYGGVLAYKAQSSSKLKALMLVGDLKKHLHRAAELDKRHIEVRWALVEIYISLPRIVGGSEDKSLKYANELLEISPVDGYLALGYVAEYNDRPKDAERYYKKAIEVGGSMHTYGKLSNLYESTNQPKMAIVNYEAANEKHQRNHLNYQIGKVAAQYNIALEKGLKCLLLYIKNHTAKDGVPKSWAYYRIAQIYRHKKDKRNAYNYIQKALAAKPDLKDAQKEKKLILNMLNK